MGGDGPAVPRHPLHGPRTSVLRADQETGGPRFKEGRALDSTLPRWPRSSGCVPAGLFNGALCFPGGGESLQTFVPEWTEAGPQAGLAQGPRGEKRYKWTLTLVPPLPRPGGPCRCSISVWVLGWPWGPERSFREKYRAEMAGSCVLRGKKVFARVTGRRPPGQWRQLGESTEVWTSWGISQCWLALCWDHKVQGDGDRGPRRPRRTSWRLHPAGGGDRWQVPASERPPGQWRCEASPQLEPCDQ